MNRSEALDHFKKNVFEKKNSQKLCDLDKYYQKHKDEFVSGFIDSFRNICESIKRMQLLQKKGKIAYITFSMLRTNILEGNSMYLVEAYDENWFLDFQKCQGQYDASWALSFLKDLITEVEDEIKTYHGSLEKPDLEKLMMMQSIKYNDYVISLVRYAMPKAVLLNEYVELEKEDELEIRVGQYRDVSEIVYKEDKTEKDSKEIKEWMEDKLEDEYAYEVFINLDLSNGNYEDIDFSYSDFSGSNLSMSNMSGCIFVGTKFIGGSIEGSDLSNSIILGAEFVNCCLKDTDFSGAEGTQGMINEDPWEMPSFSSVDFTGANLEAANFEDADLKGGIFIGANLKNVNFKGANLENASFLEEDKSTLKLSEEQINAIQWKH